MRGTHGRLVIRQIEQVDDVGLQGGGEFERAAKMRDQPLDRSISTGSRLSGDDAANITALRNSCSGEVSRHPA